MKKYNFAAIKKFAEDNAGKIETITVGMQEDWSSTADQIYAGGDFSVAIDDPMLVIAGIDGSSWATPVMEVETKDGQRVTMECFAGSSDQNFSNFAILGCLSGPCQEARNSVEVKPFREVI